MKTIFCALVGVMLFFGASAQSELGLLSTYIDKYTPTEEAPQCLKKFEKFLEEQQVLQQVASNIDGELIETLDVLFELKDPKSYIGKPEYRSLMDNYESAPENADFSISDIVEYGPEVMRNDYRLTKDQVIFVNGYPAIDDTAPFNNQDAIKNAFNVIEDVKGVAIVTVTFDNRYSVGLMGDGKSTIVADVTIRIYNKKGKGIYGKNATGIADQQIEITKEGEYNIEDLKPIFEQAVSNALVAVQTELPRSIKKIRW